MLKLLKQYLFILKAQWFLLPSLLLSYGLTGFFFEGEQRTQIQMSMEILLVGTLSLCTFIVGHIFLAVAMVKQESK